MGEYSFSTTSSTLYFRRCEHTGLALIDKRLIDQRLPEQALIREYKALKLIDGTISPRALEITEDKEGLVLTMEWVQGPLLSSVIDKGELTDDQAVSLGKMLLRTVARLHRLKVAHLDLAPTNVILSKAGAYGIVLIDFSNCAFADELPFQRPRKSFAGHWSYAAPEQMGVETDSISFNTDFFSAGLLIRALFGYEDHIADDYQSAVNFRRNPINLDRIPSHYRELIRRLLEINPNRRVNL